MVGHSLPDYLHNLTIFFFDIREVYEVDLNGGYSAVFRYLIVRNRV